MELLRVLCRAALCSGCNCIVLKAFTPIPDYIVTPLPLPLYLSTFTPFQIHRLATEAARDQVQTVRCFLASRPMKVQVQQRLQVLKPCNCHKHQAVVAVAVAVVLVALEVVVAAASEIARGTTAMAMATTTLMMV